jgi:hypothetical protein
MRVARAVGFDIERVVRRVVTQSRTQLFGRRGSESLWPIRSIRVGFGRAKYFLELLG